MVKVFAINLLGWY